MRNWFGVLAVAVSVSLAASAAAAAAHKTTVPAPKKRHVTRHWHGYGFLPGYRSPEQIEWEQAQRRGRSYGYPYYWDDTARYYHGRWNGGSFGPCWTQTPIGAVWNCGK